jgi:selenide,water dikinase
MEAAVARAWAEAYPDRAGGSPAEHPADSAVLDAGPVRLLMTEDFGPVVCNDLERAGRVAALHALSDVYACLGTPRWARVLFVAKTGATVEQMATLLTGVYKACAADGVEVAGGHSIVSAEWMAGLAVVGTVGPRGPLTKRGARDGDRLLLSKPLGCGAVLRAYRLGQATEADLDEALAVMTTSNRGAAAHAAEARVHAGTDVTGFGLLGSLAEMLDGDLGATLTLQQVPVLAATRRLGGRFGHSRWIDGNWDYARDRRRVVGVRELPQLLPLLDPQTNGGLLVAADEQAAARLAAQGAFTVIGEVNQSAKIEVKP